MTRFRRRSDPAPAPPVAEWVGGRFLIPAYAPGSDPPYRPELVLWVEVPGEAVLAVDSAGPAGVPDMLLRTLRDALEKPPVGPRRRPGRIRVADPVDAAKLRRVLGPSIEVVVGPVPKIADVARAMAPRTRRMNPMPRGSPARRTRATRRSRRAGSSSSRP